MKHWQASWGIVICSMEGHSCSLALGMCMWDCSIPMHCMSACRV